MLTIGVASGALAFMATLGWLTWSQNRAPAASGASSLHSAHPIKLASARIVTSVPEAVVYVDGRLCVDGVIRAEVGSTHVVRVQAPGRPTVQRDIRIDSTDSEIRIDLPPSISSVDATPSAAPSEPNEAVGASATPASRATKHRPAERNGSAATDGGPLGAGLRLKTDIP
jgi:hypothetical protein